MTPRPCLEPGCRRLTASGSRCPAHARARETARSRARAATEPWQAWYSSPAYRAARRLALARAGGQCEAELVAGGRCPVRAGLDTHHVQPARLAPALFNDPDNLLVLCRPHHAEIEAADRARRARRQ